MTVTCALSVTALIITTLSTATSIIWSLLSQIRGLKVKARSLVPVCFVSLKNPLDSSVDLLPVWRTGLTGSESFSEGMAAATQRISGVLYSQVGGS